MNQIFQSRVDVTIQNRKFVITVTGKALYLFAFDLKGTLVFIHTVTIKDTYFNDCPEITWLYPQRRITHIRGFLPKDRTKEFFLWRHRAFTFWRNFTYENITWFHISTNVDNASLIQIAERFFTHIWNITSDFLWPKLRVTGSDFKLFNVNRSKHIITRNPLRDQNGVFIVISIPRHEGDNHVFTQRQFTKIG